MGRNALISIHPAIRRRPGDREATPTGLLNPKERVTPRVENLTLWQRVHGRLREEILANRLRPGQELTEQALSAQLGVSRAPVREALGRLAQEGLVTIRPRRGAVVAEVTPEDFLEAYQTREALEALAIRLAMPRLGAADLAELDRLIAEQAQLAEAHDVDAFFESNGHFHELIVRLSGNRTLLDIYQQLTARVRRYRTKSLALRGSLARSVEEHRSLVRAIERGDVDEAVRLLVEHIRVPQHRLDEGGETELVLKEAVPA